MRPLLLGVAALGVGGCASDSVLKPASPDAGRVATLGWLLFGAATLVTIGVFVYLVAGLFRRGRAEGPDSERAGERWVIGGGVVLPVVVLLPMLGFGVAILNRHVDPTMHVEVIGHQYWWEYRYTDDGFVTANELHIPIDTPVELTLRSDDVIHSFWVPSLGGKTDLIPGHVNHLTLQADEVGTYRGKCAEYCGLQHAKMLFLVVAQSRGDFGQWVDQQRRDASPSDSRGAQLFESKSCASCHTVSGTDAEGRLGPDLTHIASRQEIGAGVLENTPANMRRWIGHTWEVKDHIAMPEIPLTDDEVAAITSYLESLK